VEYAGDSSIPKIALDSLRTAISIGLTACDSLYLELMGKENDKLATFDGKLREAVETLGLKVYSNT